MAHPDTPAPERPAYLIRKNGYWYRPNSCGYTASTIQAGRYTLKDAIKITHPNGPGGPRDGMEFYHEDTINDEDWRAFSALSAERDALKAELAEAIDVMRFYSDPPNTMPVPDFYSEMNFGGKADAFLAKVKDKP